MPVVVDWPAGHSSVAEQNGEVKRAQFASHSLASGPRPFVLHGSNSKCQYSRSNHPASTFAMYTTCLTHKWPIDATTRALSRSDKQDFSIRYVRDAVHSTVALPPSARYAFAVDKKTFSTSGRHGNHMPATEGFSCSCGT